ncbi:MAG: hypothetical protein EBQ95_06185 [Gammaproteobacteria bacterium]|nr:hypothetical protein [Gammaproteobacteria bacterium]
MNNPNASEISLRRAVAIGSKQADPISAIRDAANSQLDILQQAGGALGGFDTKSLQADAIGLAVQGLGIAYHVLSMKSLESKMKRQQFAQECCNHLATFTLNLEKEKYDFYNEEKAIQAFINLSNQEYTSLYAYLGIQEQVEDKIHQYSILPYYRMSQSLEQKNLASTRIDEHQQSIFLLLKTGLPNKIYYDRFQQSSKIALQLEGVISGDNYLNHYRAPLFIINAIANLLWNLQHPVHNDTGILLPLSRCIEKCIQADLYINHLIDNPLIKNIDSENILKHFFIKVNIYVENLKKTFEEQLTNQVNLNDVSSSMHHALRIMAEKIMELIYHDKFAAHRLIDKFMFIGQLILKDSNSNLIEKVYPQLPTKNIPVLNTHPCTLTDFIILFLHDSPNMRLHRIKKLKKSKSELLLSLGETLEEINATFILPFEHIASKHAPQDVEKLWDKSDTFLWIAKNFIAFMTMIMECYTIFDDTRSKSFAHYDTSMTDKQQRDIILKRASSKAADSYYLWSLSIFLANQSQAAHNFDQLLYEQSKMLMMTDLLDNLGNIILENRIFLQQPEFQKMLMDCLKKILKEYQSFNVMLNKIENAMNNSETILRHEKRILQPMLDDLESTLDSIQESIKFLNQVIGHQDFTAQQQQLMLAKTANVKAQFANIFQGQFNIPIIELSNTPPPETQAVFDGPSAAMALGHLAEKCYVNLSSYFNNQDTKGLFLQQIIDTMNDRETIDEDTAKHYFLELLRMTATPRKSWFFQAEYGKTRSAKILIDAVLDPVFNHTFPIAKMLFPKCSDIQTLTDDIVLEKIRQLKTERKWDDTVSEDMLAKPA